MLSVLRVILLFSISWQHLHTATTQYVPPVACPDYFQYLSYGNQYIGKITLPNLPMGTTKIDVIFSQREPVVSNYYGRLSLYQDQETTIYLLQNGQPIAYRVDFPLQNVLPKLTRIAVNDVDICIASDYPPPSTTLRLQHTLHAISTTVRKPQPFNLYGNELENPFTNTAVQPTFSTPNRNSNPIFNPNDYGTNNPFFASMPPVFRQPPNPPTTTRVNNEPSASTPANLVGVCGQEGGNFVTPFIHGGSILARGQFPWLVAIYKKQSDGLTFLCGGSLISTRSVVTAAHCFKLKNLSAHQILVYVGRYNLTDYNEQGALTREVQALVMHPEYNVSSFPDADIAVVHLQLAVNFNQYIQPVCLWSGDDSANQIVGQTAVVSGWGADETGRTVSDVPKQVGINIVSEVECLRMDVFKDWTTPRTICAGNRDGTGPCMGDSGGGLMLNRNGRWMLRGIVSAGRTIQQRCNLHEYVIYCDLAKHLTWVQSNLLV